MLKHNYRTSVYALPGKEMWAFLFNSVAAAFVVVLRGALSSKLCAVHAAERLICNISLSQAQEQKEQEEQQQRMRQ